MGEKMTEIIKIESEDAKRLESMFRDLQYKDQRNIVISALRKSTKPVIPAVKGNIIHSVTGNLKKSIGLLSVRNEPAIIIAARKRSGFKGFHGHFLEDGTEERKYITKSGAEHRTGRMHSSKSYAGYFRKGVDATNQIAINTMGDEWYRAIEKYHQKHRLK